MAEELILAMDVGTTSVKAAVLGTDGRQVAGFRSAYPTARSRPAWVDQDPADWLTRIDQALADFAAQGLPALVRAVGLTSQVNTHLFLDRDARPLMPAITWSDTRAAAEAAELDARVTSAQKIAWWGAPMPIDASHVLARMLWAQRHRPDIWDRTAHVVLPKDYALHHLTGVLATDPLSNIGLTDGAGWIAGVLALVPGAAERMAPLVPPQAVMGRARSIAPIAGADVVTATMDGWCALYGSGGSAEGAGVYVSGTSEVLGIAAAAIHPTPGVVVFPPLADLRLHAGPTQAGGAALHWFAETARLTVEQVSDLVAKAPRAAATPLFLPQLQGERAPLWDPSLRGAFLGLDQSAGLPDMARAVMEGVALSARHVLGALESSAGTRPDILTCGGGGFRSDVWTQIRADVLGRPMARLTVNEPGLIGAAALAAVGTGLAPDVRTAQLALARTEAPVMPNPEMRGFHDDLFGLYTQAIAANAGIGAGLIALAARRGS